MIAKHCSGAWKWALCLVVLACSTAPMPGYAEMSKADSINTARRHLSFGNNYFKNGQFEDAETQFLRAWEHNPEQAQTARFLGRLYHRMENYEGAIHWYKEAIALEPQGQHTKTPYQALADIYVMQENPEEAIACYEALLEFAPEADEEIKYLHSLVRLYVDTQNLEQALECAKRWGDLAPDDPEVRSMIGQLHQHTGGADEALAEMEKVLEMNPNDHVTREKIADMYQSRGELDKAFDAYEILYQNDPKNYYFLEKTASLGRALKKSKTFIIGRLERMHALQPSNLSVIEQLAELTEDLKWINLGLRQDGRNGKYPYMLGEHYFDKWKTSQAPRDSVEALTWFKRAQNDPMWVGNATAMIQTLDPPLSEEEKMRRKFFEESRKKTQEVNQEGKK